MIASFAIAGLVIPFALFPLWWMATRDHPVLKPTYLLDISRTLFPGQRGIFLAWSGPIDWGVIVVMWIKALAKNAVIYALVGVVTVFLLRLRHKSLFSK